MIENRQKIINNIEDLSKTINPLDLTDIYSTLYSRTSERTVFSSEHETLSRIDHMLGHKTNIDKYKKIEII